jgi:hypothetical protein
MQSSEERPDDGPTVEDREILGRSTTLSSEILRQWHNGLRLNHIAHNQACTYYHRLGRLLGIAVVVLSSVVGTAIFASLQSSPDTRLRILTGLLSVTAAVLSTLQMFLRYGDLADKHHVAAQAYGTLRRKLELRLVTMPAETPAEYLEELRSAWDDTDATSPALPQRLHNRVFRRVTLNAKSLGDEQSRI